MGLTRNKRKTDPEIVIARDTDSELSSSSSEEEEDNDPLSESEEEDEAVKNGGKIELEKNKAKGKAPITVKLIKKVCKVCKQPGHEAGFKGATYIDCPMKPCFLCKMPGHTTMSCPHRVVTDHGILPTSHRNTKNPIDFVFKRQLQPRIPPIKPKYLIPDQVHCAVIRYHSRRVTCLEFHPTKNNILLSGDKKGQIGVWDFAKVYEKNVYGNIHSVQVNNMRFSPTNDDMVYSASSDGTIGYTDLETGTSSTLLNINPDGWQGPNNWKMLYGMDINSEKGVVLAADNFGFLHMIDHRTNNGTGEPILIHKQGSKVVGLDCNPVQPELLLSCGNDHFARIWDMRKLQPKASLYDLAHKRVVNSAYFSPSSGTKILTTCQDNRIRIWDSIFGNLDLPSREIVHSNDFNRHLTPFKAEWDPKDTSESLIVVGRYISENYNGTALHPIDFIDASNGQLVAEVMDPNITTITPVNKLHPRDDVLASGSSRSLFIWRPQDKTEMVEEKKDKKIIICYGDSKKNGKKQKRGSDDEDDEDDMFISKGKNIKLNKPQAKTTKSTRKTKT
ncbi:WD40-repeat-containing domain superfamily [Arabidopsis suecica]|uniref:UV-damaged DNA-binding protein 2 n=1 Tax=Arabidopsis suecica TaxID=45249 RepID=A0A8T1XVX1_ARASU|nr:WD40-repeat-containing domain superfamily [Arabidopsis suecica]